MEIDVSKVGFDQLRLHYYVGWCHSRFSGRNKEYTYMHYALTDLGEIELNEWIKLAQRMIEYHHEEQIQEQLLEWVSEHNYCGDSKAKLLQESLELHMSRIFDNPEWVGFVSFNQRYRPDTLRQTELRWVETVCCKMPGLTTAAQVEGDKARQGRICCPICGRFSEFRVCDAP